jgi:ankyrin repeat protein
MVNLLLDNGADIDSKNKEYQRPSIFYAIWDGNKEMVRLLIARGANFNIKDKNNMTPLIRALNKDQQDIAVILIEKGADIEAVDDFGRSAMKIATKKRMKRIIELLKNFE